MKIQILKSTQVNQQHCEVMDVVEVDAAMANNLIDAKNNKVEGTEAQTEQANQNATFVNKTTVKHRAFWNKKQL